MCNGCCFLHLYFLHYLHVTNGSTTFFFFGLRSSFLKKSLMLKPMLFCCFCCFCCSVSYCGGVCRPPSSTPPVNCHYNLWNLRSFTLHCSSCHLRFEVYSSICTSPLLPLLSFWVCALPPSRSHWCSSRCFSCCSCCSCCFVSYHGGACRPPSSIPPVICHPHSWNLHSLTLHFSSCCLHFAG